MKRIAIIIFLLLAFITSFSQSSWELKKNSQGIKVYLKSVEDSKIKAFKATTTINASLNEIYKVIATAKDYSSWVDQVSYSKCISKSSSNFVVYYQINLPAGFKNRDIVLDNKIISKTSKQIKIGLKSAPNSYPIQKKFIRIKKANGFWLLTKNGNKTTVSYQFYSDPEGNFPTWLINVFLVDGPYKTLLNLKNKF